MLEIGGDIDMILFHLTMLQIAAWLWKQKENVELITSNFKCVHI